MNELQIFKNEKFGEVRTMSIDGEPWFMGKDVAEILGYANTPKAIRDHIDAEDKMTERIVLSGQNREVVFINESGLYSLILRSKLPSAKEFKHWVTSEILPSIRKHGGYITGQEHMTGEELLARAVKYANSKIEELESKVEVMTPKAIFADAVSTSKTSILIGDLAKLLKQNGIDMGQKRLFDWMRNNGYLIKQKGTSYNRPTQRSMEMGLFEVKESSFVHPDGHTGITMTTKVTGKGQVYFTNKFLTDRKENKI